MQISKNATPLLSVVIPCYNTERYLGEAIQSVLDQAYAPLEIIVVDDGSTDSSGDVARRFDSVVQCIRQENGGISRARNTGIERAKGELLAFLDADDLWTPGSLSVRYDSLRSEPHVEAVYGGVEHFVSPELTDIDIAKYNIPPVMTARLAGTMLIDRQAFLRAGLFNPDLRVGEMMDWVARAEYAGVKSRLLPDVVMHRRIHGNNTVLKQKQSQTDYLRALRASITRQRASAGATTNKDGAP